MAHTVGCLPSKHKATSSNPSTTHTYTHACAHTCTSEHTHKKTIILYWEGVSLKGRKTQKKMNKTQPTTDHKDKSQDSKF
jgi:hypothetical protein